MDPLQLLSQSLRGAIVAPPGKLLFVADYASIEARVLSWCAKEEADLEAFRRNEDLYSDLASTIFHKPINKKDHPAERQLGKIGKLGLGFQMWWPKFKVTCDKDAQLRKLGLVVSDELAEQTVRAYRQRYRKIVQLWYDQETAAGEATCDPGETYECYPCSWVIEGKFLYCTLPSGRRLAYPFPQVKVMDTPWGKKNTLTHMGVNPTTKKWHRQSVYGGLLVENIVQSISRDIMAEAMIRCEESQIYSPILTIHDELVCEAHKDLGDVEEYTALIGQCPAWCKGCPVAAESWAGTRYRK